MLFSSLALIGLVAVGPKFAWREQQLRQRFEGRQRAMPGAQDERGIEAAPAAGAIDGQDVPAEPGIYRLWPLVLLAAAVWIVSVVMLWREVLVRNSLEEQAR